MNAARYYARLLALPLAFLFFSLTLRIVWSAFDLPGPEVIADQAGALLARYGLPVVFVSSIVEGMLLLGGYFPGVFVIFVAVVLAESATQAALAVAAGSAGLLVAHVANYLLGRYGWYRLLARFGLSGALRRAEQDIGRRGPVAILASYWMPSIAALTDTAAGVLRMRFRTFFLYAVAGTIFWNSLVGAAVYLLGRQALAFATPGGTDLWIVVLMIVLWSAGLFLLDRQRRRKEGKAS